MNFKTEVWPIGRFIHYARNPRKNDAQVDRMVASIKEFGFRIPVVAKSDGSVVDGHLRLKAAVALGMSEVPVALADELSEAQVKAFRLLANRSANWAEWDNDLLALELSELGDMGFDMALTGFDEGELAALLAPAAGGDGAGDPGEARQTLAARFGLAPFSVLNAREGWWQERKRAWLALGIQSELGRGSGNDCAPGGGGGIWGHAGPSDLYGKSQRQVPTASPNGKSQRQAPTASPGGSARPACDYGKSKARGDGHGRAMRG